MTNLNSLFDVISFDPHPNAGASLVTVLDVANTPGPYQTTTDTGTPKPGDIFPGAIVVMDATGKAVLADNANALTDAPSLLYVAVDGDQDNDGAFVHRITCLQGGMELRLELANYVAGTYAVGDKLTCATGADAGKFRVAVSGEQIYGVVGQNGLNTNNSTLHAIVPQGIAPAVT